MAFISPHKYIKREDGKIVVARKGVSGVLVIAKGGSMPENQAKELGLYDIIPEPEGPQLKTNGPTFEEWKAAGYPEDKYPPNGYEERPSTGYSVYLQNKKRQEQGLRPTTQSPMMNDKPDKKEWDTGEGKVTGEPKKPEPAPSAEPSQPSALPLGTESKTIEDLGKGFPPTIGGATEPQK